MNPGKTAANCLTPELALPHHRNSQSSQGVWEAFMPSPHDTAAHQLDPNQRHIGSPAVPAEAALGIA